MLIDVFWGDNGCHEFWESARGVKPNITFIRNHGEEAWTVNVDGRVCKDVERTRELQARSGKFSSSCLGASTSEETAVLLSNQEGIDVDFRRDLRWELGADGNYHLEAA